MNRSPYDSDEIFVVDAQSQITHCGQAMRAFAQITETQNRSLVMGLRSLASDGVSTLTTVVVVTVVVVPVATGCGPPL